MEDIPRRLAGSGVAIGTVLSDVREIQEKYRWGYRLLTVGTPLSYGLGVLAQHVRTLRANPGGEPAA